MTDTNERNAVTQADRDAAAAYIQLVRSTGWGGVDGILSGSYDNTSIVQAFAAHRIAAEAAQRERDAEIIQRRMDKRFEAYGVREYDTNDCYYPGAAGEIYESLDEESFGLIEAIREQSA